MLRPLVLATAASALFGVATSAQAIIVEIDPFNTGFDATNPGGPGAPVILSGTDSATTTATLTNGNVRNATFEIVANGSPGGANNADIRIADGELQIDNQSQVRSRITLTYDVGTSLDDALASVGGSAAARSTLNIRTVFADAPRTLSLFVNGELADTQIVTQSVGSGGTLLTQLSYSAALLDNGMTDTLSLVINSGAGSDYRIEILNAEFAVPAPAALALFGLGLGLVGLRRTQRA
ncbi:MAG: PEP-CTERM sorting domain-containing protein [Pacificimonas sp.]